MCVCVSECVEEGELTIQTSECVEEGEGTISAGLLRDHHCLCGKRWGLGVCCAQLYSMTDRAQELCESRDGRHGLPVPNSPSGHGGRKATLN